MSMTTTEFASAARAISRHCRAHSLVAPSFRCPPKEPDVNLTVRFINDGALVSVRLAGRPPAQVVADMIEGALIANRCGPNHAPILAEGLRGALS